MSPEVGSAPDWAAYLGGLAAFAGTLFALVLAARQIRGPSVATIPRRTARAYLIDSIAVTVELGAAALLAILVTIEGSPLFSIAVSVVALVGVALSLASAIAWIRALNSNSGRWVRWGALAQAVGNTLPLACYAVAGLFAVRALHFDEAAWGFAAAVSWLTFSGTVQAVLWYVRLWEKPALSRADG